LRKVHKYSEILRKINYLTLKIEKKTFSAFLPKTVFLVSAFLSNAAFSFSAVSPFIIFGVFVGHQNFDVFLKQSILPLEKPSVISSNGRRYFKIIFVKEKKRFNL